MMRHVLLTAAMSLAAVLIGSIEPAAVSQGGEVKMRVSQFAQVDSPPYVAVIGQVGRPGVFELSRPLPQLAEFLNLAGGTTPSASGSIRLIRGGRSSQFFLSPKLALQLIPGDLVVVESKRFVAGSQNGNFAAGGNVDTQSTFVQIGLVNLISRPVVLDMPREQANVAQVLSLLHQPVNANAEITLIAPGSGVQTFAVEQAFEATLSTGMVLVFDPSTVNSAVLPRLPSVRRPADDAESPAAGTNAAAAPVVAPKPLPSAGPAIQIDSPAGRPISIPQTGKADSPDGTSAAAAPAATETAPAESDAAAADAPASKSLDVTVPPTALSSESADADASLDVAEEKSPEKQTATASGQSAMSILWQMTVAVLVAGGIGIMLRTRSRRQPQPVAVAPSVEPVVLTRDELEMLISAALPIVEEPLQLAYESEIFGRPREASPSRTDSAQALTGPHYIPQPAPAVDPTEEVPAAVPAETATAPASTATERKVRVDMRHPRSTVSALDRALATFEREQP